MNTMPKIRHKRFSPKKNKPLELIIKQEKQEATFAIEDLSLYGMSVSASHLDFLTGGTTGLFEEAIISSQDSQFELGRILIKHQSEKKVGFFCIDKRIPIESYFSKFLERSKENPYDYELNPEKFTVKDFGKNTEPSRSLLDKCYKFEVLLKDWEQRPQYQYHVLRERSKGKNIHIQQHTKPFLVTGSNDYLGLSAHPRVIEAAKKALDTYGFGSTGSPLTTGLSIIHEELSEFLAQFVHKEKVILFNSGYAANIGTIQGLVGEHDLVASDFLAHASLQDGMKLSRGTSKKFSHNNPQDLDNYLQSQRDKFAGCLVLTEGVFSMDGDTANLDEIVAVAEKHDAAVLLDEAHSLGVIGDRGEGLAANLQLTDKVDIIMGTFSKCFGGIGGFIAGSDAVCDWLYWMGKSHMFSVAIPPSTAAAVLEAGKIIVEEPERVQRLQKNIEYFCHQMRSVGAPIPTGHQSAVIPVIIGSPRKMGVMTEALLERGILATPIVYPAVRDTECRFRFTMNAEFSKEELDYIVESFQAAMSLAEFDFEGISSKHTTTTFNTAGS